MHRLPRFGATVGATDLWSSVPVAFARWRSPTFTASWVIGVPHSWRRYHTRFVAKALRRSFPALISWLENVCHEGRFLGCLTRK
jgi:hypothetical protein